MKTETPEFEKVLIDADILVYRCGFAAEGEEEWVAKHYVDKDITRIADTTGCANFTCYLTSSDKSNFRYNIYPQYKANRVQPKPKHYEMLRKVLREDYGAVTVEGEEADDAIGKAHNPKTTCIATIDKDLDMIPGWHYNWVKEVMYQISPIEATRWFCQQLLMGDPSDNIPGIRGIGKVRANRMLEGCTSENEMYELVIEQFLSRNVPPKELQRNAELLWIRQGTHRNGVLDLSGALDNFLKNEESSTNSNETS